MCATVLAKVRCAYGRSSFPSMFVPERLTSGLEMGLVVRRPPQQSVPPPGIAARVVLRKQKEHVMRVVKQMGLALVAVLALSAIAVSSASASPVFLSHPLGLLLASAGSNQILEAGGLKVTCTALKLLPPGDTTNALISLAILAVVDYEKCTGTLGIAIHVDPVRYLIDANGLVTLENTALLLGPEGCVITIPSGPNQSLKTIKIENTVNSGILLLAAVTGITASGVGGPLNACEFATVKNSTDTGTIHVSLDPTPGTLGTIKWDLNA
jgi:hypothetical protein